MKGVVDLAVERAAREQPDEACRFSDDFGRPMQLYALEYRMDGRSWANHVLAYSIEDAEARVTAMRQSLVVLGQVHAVGPT